MPILEEKICTCDSCEKRFTPENERQRFCAHCKEHGFQSVCQHCGEDFLSTHDRAKFCSEDCRKEGLRLNDRTCLFCREGFEAQSTNQLYCCKDCADMASGKFTRTFQLTCHTCEGHFEAEDPRTLFCSKGCEEKSTKRFCLHCSVHFHTEEHGQVWCSTACRDKLKLNECKKCGTVFYHKMKKTFCSDECRKRPCKQCDRPFIPKNSEVFCGDVCKRMYYTHTCVACEEKFFKPVQNAKFCSTACRDSLKVAEKHRKICRNCKKVMTVLSEDVHFCSMECKIDYRKPGNHKREKKKKDEEIKNIVTERVDILLEKRMRLLRETIRATINYWDIDGFTESLKEQVLVRDERHCYICEQEERLEVHHIVPRKLGGAHEMDNLVTLCHKCHRHIETGDRDHAIKKCMQNAKLTMGVPEMKLKERLNKVEQVNYLEQMMEGIYRSLAENGSEELQEPLMQLDDFLDELEVLKKEF